ncbi:hypothetical protein G7Y89_g3482 [Cudoniella acicularis]|uniref:Calcium uniporter protein, mitochondrial n=1 Tax=Cudoniella acicularis TaxID=354080 RepID=A0A8H4RU96_9HELO|nr:hypothetical protein G7Y89_g3482 [Cudoniella acicularis]
MAITSFDTKMQDALTASRRRAPPSDFSYLPTNNTNFNFNNIEETDLKPRRKHQAVPTIDRVDRTSFSSIKENNSGVAQSFTTTKTSSYLNKRFNLESQDEEAIDDGLVTPPEGMSGLITNPHNVLHGFVKGYMMHMSAIIDQLATDIPPNGFTARNIDLMSLLLTSCGMHAATLATLYNNITIPHSRIFRKFLSHVSEYPALGTIVRRLDFSHFNPTGAGMTARERAQTLNLIPETLLRCLSLTPNLREFLAQEHIDDEIDAKVIKTLLCDLPKLNALDLCACGSTSFRDSFTAVIDASPSPLPTELPITRLSLHECPILPSRVFSVLLPRLTHLTHLDVAHTRITDEALFSIPTTARLTHLNLSKCTHLTGDAVVQFISSHPAAKTLVYLNLAMDSKSHEMLTSEEITVLLPSLPRTMRSLNLKGSKMNNIHIPLLLPLTKHLEELGLGRNLNLPDLCKLFVPDEDLELEEQVAWIPHSLRYIDVSDLSAGQLDLGTLFGSRCPVLKGVTAPLEVLELGSDVFKKLEKSPVVKRVGWCLKEAGRRYWLVRVDGADAEDSGARTWKWGACTSRRQEKDEYKKKAKELNQKGLDEQEHGFNSQLDNAIGEEKELQARTPWHKEGSDRPPVKRMRSAGAMTKGKLLTTPSGLLKLILPLTTLDKNTDRKSIEPLALLVHPQQPLSYLERLIQSELPMIRSKDGKEKIPDVFFRAEDSAQDEITTDTCDEVAEEDVEEGSDEQMADGKVMKLGKIKNGKGEGKNNIESGLRGGLGKGGVEIYSGKGREASSPTPGEQKFVRWSSSTEIGDFIRDAARGKEFAVEIEGASKEVRIGVPSFNDRTHYLRVRLRKTSRKLENLASVKKECDDLAYRSAQRLAMGGFGVLLTWWAAIYHFTFQTDYGWDTMEPITYLAGLSTIMLGYLWFLYHNREVSYRSALNLTVSRRQHTLYQARGFDLQKWEGLIEEANSLRKEIKGVANEYDVEWDERGDEGSEVVHDALKERDKKKGKDEDEDNSDGGK